MASRQFLAMVMAGAYLLLVLTSVRYEDVSWQHQLTRACALFTVIGVRYALRPSSAVYGRSVTADQRRQTAAKVYPIAYRGAVAVALVVGVLAAACVHWTEKLADRFWYPQDAAGVLLGLVGLAGFALLLPFLIDVWTLENQNRLESPSTSRF